VREEPGGPGSYGKGESMRRNVAICAVGLVLGSLITAPAFAGKPSGGGSNTGTYSVTVTPGGPYSFGQQIYTTTNTPVYPNGAGPWIELMCYQNGTLVASGDHAGFSAGWYYNWPWNLGPTQSWSGGAADCTVRVFHTGHSKQVTDATTSFHVDG